MDRSPSMWKLALALPLLTLGCGGDPAPAVGLGPRSPCVLEQTPLVLTDGTELHLDTQNLFRIGDDWLLSGAPSYQFDVAPGRDAINVSRHEHVAAFLGRPARAVANPLGASALGSVLSTPLGDGRWAAVFDELRSDSMPTVPLAYWYGEHDGAKWSLLEPLPVPSGWEVSFRESSALVRVGDRLVWIAFERRGTDPWILRRYERADGVWRSEPLPDEWVERVVLTVAENSAVWLLLSGEDPDLPGFQKSIRLYREGPPRELVSRVAVVPGSVPEIRESSLQVRGGTASVSWVLASPEGSRAFAQVGIRTGEPGTLVPLDDDAPHVYSMTMPDGSLAWVADHVVPGAQRNELRLLRLEGSRVAVTATAPSPFTGFFRAQPGGPNEVLLVGAQMGLAPTETPVRSLILRLSASC